MVEVVNSLVESPKCVAHESNGEMEALAQNYRNQILRFGKPERSVLSGSIADKGTVDSDEDILLPAKWHLTRGRARTTTNPRGCSGGY
jgi:hypothetical protein